MMSNSFLRRWRHRVFAIIVVFANVRMAAFAQSLAESQRSRIDTAVPSILAASGAPSASIAVVQNGRIVYENAYGSARIGVPATSAMRYSIGSVTKQFAATAVLLLAEEGKLSIDDKVSKWLPDLTQADNVTIRQLLSMTAGYQDFWPQDYLFPAMLSPTTPRDILAQWARKPLDFKPGTAWQYSNTNYFAVWLIVEKVSGMPLMEFLERRIFTPLSMTSIRNVDSTPLEDSDAGGYLRNALGPLRPSPKAATGWLFAGGIRMTAHDLALWDIAMINRTVLKPESYREMFKEGRLSNGNRTGYGLGVALGSVDGHKRIAHDGAAAGFMAANTIYPDDRVAVVTFVNIYPGSSDPEWDISNAIGRIIFENKKRREKPGGGGNLKADTKTLNQIRQVFFALQNGEIDRSLFTPNANAYFTTEALADFASSLGPLGAPTEFRLTGLGLRGGMILSTYRGVCGDVALTISVITLPDGKIEQYLVARVAQPNSE